MLVLGLSVAALSGPINGPATGSKSAVRTGHRIEPDDPAPPPTPPPNVPAGFPDGSNTGVPAGTSLSGYTGPCTISTNNAVIDAQLIKCNLTIRATGVRITRSRLEGHIASSGGGSFVVEDSEIVMSPGTETGIGDRNFTVTRTEITGGNRGVNCETNCVVRDSWIHGQAVPSNSDAHASGMRASQDTTYIHNTVSCDARDNSAGGGCSAAITMYGDFAAVQRVTIEGNLIKGDSGGYCAYGGSSAGKPYSTQARDIVYRNNVFERGSTGKCGFWGPITAFDSSRPGNVWANNKWTDGATVPPAN